MIQNILLYETLTLTTSHPEEVVCKKIDTLFESLRSNNFETLTKRNKNYLDSYSGNRNKEHFEIIQNRKSTGRSNPPKIIILGAIQAAPQTKINITLRLMTRFYVLLSFLAIFLLFSGFMMSFHKTTLRPTILFYILLLLGYLGYVLSFKYRCRQIKENLALFFEAEESNPKA
jgi:hypothetical protein